MFTIMYITGIASRKQLETAKRNIKRTIHHSLQIDDMLELKQYCVNLLLPPVDQLGAIVARASSSALDDALAVYFECILSRS